MNQKESVRTLLKGLDQINKKEFDLNVALGSLAAYQKGANPENAQLIADTEAHIKKLHCEMVRLKMDFNNQLIAVQPFVVQSPVHPIFHGPLRTFGLL